MRVQAFYLDRWLYIQRSTVKKRYRLTDEFGFVLWVVSANRIKDIRVV